MESKIKFKKSKIIFAITFSIIFLVISIWFILEPKIFVRNVFMKEWHIILLGVISFIYFLNLLYSYLIIISRPYGVIINKEYFIDNSKYEALGKIKWDEVSKIKRIKKTSIQIYLKKNLSEKFSNNLLKMFLLMMHNWEYKNSIIISSALLDCNIDFLEAKILLAYKNQKLKK